jgi:hypothetical protein
LGSAAAASTAAAAATDIAATATRERAAAKKKPMVMKKPIRMHEPMTSPMAKPSMMKEDVHEGMMRQEAQMKEMMEEEARSMK